MLENEEKRSVESYNLHLIHKIILNIAEKFGADVALEKLDELEKQIMMLGDNPYMGQNQDIWFFVDRGIRC